MTVKPKEEKEIMSVQKTKKSQAASCRSRSRRRSVTMTIMTSPTLTIFIGVRQSSLARRSGLPDRPVAETVRKCTFTVKGKALKLFSRKIGRAFELRRIIWMTTHKASMKNGEKQTMSSFPDQ
jgi:hypothetical protein